MPPQTGRCPNCFGATAVTPCSHCGWQVGQDNPPPALALGRVLDGRYRVGRVLGHGGFGITYLAWDDNLQLRLAIKEYLPRDCVSRGPDGVSLAIYSGQAGDQFAYGLDRFLEEARTLAHFDQHPGIVTVKNFFRAHGTGYCVMDYVAGITLRQYLDQQPGGRISVADALRLLTPVMDALRAVHKEGLLHRDLAPDNIYLTQDGRIKLLDFGAARFAASEHSKSLSIILKPGYAPEEQYRTKGNQGPWTDVYGLAATFYRAITGSVPPEALDRLDEDELLPPSKRGVSIKPDQEAILLKALAVKAAHRYQNIGELQQAWRNANAPGHPSQADEKEGMPDTVAPSSEGKERSTRKSWLMPSIAGLALAVLLALAGYVLRQEKSTPTLSIASDTSTHDAPRAAPSPVEQIPTQQPSRAIAPLTLEDGVAAFNQGDYDQAMAIWRPLAGSGDAKAQFKLGILYAQGKGVAQDDAEAVAWYRKAAAQGLTEAQFNLGVMYKTGRGVPQNDAEAAYWYGQAAEQNDPHAQFNLGIMYANGKGVAQDDAEAVRWYQKAADQGLAVAQFNLGLMHVLGRGVSMDKVEAVRWFRMAADQGIPEAQFSLGAMYNKGRGVAQDDIQAAYWYRKAAEQGIAEAQFSLGSMHRNGRGVPKDEAEAVRWLRMAAEQGIPEAQVALNAISKNRK